MSEPAAPHHSSVSDRQEIDSLYTPLDEAVAELRRRRANPALCAAVAEFERSLPPTFAPAEPFAALFRHIITPTHEFDHFVHTVRLTGLRPLYLEYQRDIFVARNRDKYRLCRPAFTVRCNQVRSLRLVDFTQMEGRAPLRLKELKSKNGNPLNHWHHHLLECAHPDSGLHLADISDWFSQSTEGQLYYVRYLALFVSRGILFENFVAHDAEERRFAQERVIPSFAQAVEIFGVRPLIVPLLPRETEHSDFWRCHPGSLHSYALELMRAKP